MIKKLNRINDDLNIYSADDFEKTKKYGKKIEYDFSSEINFIKKETKIPDEGTIYIPHVDGAETENISRGFFGEMPVQIGVCHGHNSLLNGLEYHKGSEIVVAVTDLVLLVAHFNDIVDDKIDSSKVEGIYLNAGEAFEMYQTTLHYAPSKVSDMGFMSIIILPDGTNYPLEKPANDKMLFMKNKWLIVHEEHKKDAGDNAYEGITGINIELKY
ncbi:MAG: DUF4867 family protein [Eubacteriales bacterium]